MEHYKEKERGEKKMMADISGWERERKRENHGRKIVTTTTTKNCT